MIGLRSTAVAAALLAAGCAGLPVTQSSLLTPTTADASASTTTATLSLPEISTRAVTIICTGDIMPAHRLTPLLRQNGPVFPWKNIRPVISDADIIFFNLEVPIGVTSTPFPKKYNFLMAPRDTKTLFESGARPVAGLANNHILDQGEEAFDETLLALDHQSIHRCGGGRSASDARRPAFVSVDGTTVAFLAYSHTQPEEFYAGKSSPGTAFASEASVREDVAAARARADHVVVSFHWGTEYDPTVKPHQRELARAAVQAGADVVVGHHAHTPQGSELIDGKPVVYGLGNFIFGTANEKAKGAVLRVTFVGNSVHLELTPIDVNNMTTGFQSRPFAGYALEAALDDLGGLKPSLPWKKENGRLVWTSAELTPTAR
jgi:poly-gamma-glutamate synthesis protein (capsule biosynthesis protein)